MRQSYHGERLKHRIPVRGISALFVSRHFTLLAMARLIFAYVALFLWVALAAARYDYNHVLKGCYQVKPHISWAGGYARTQQEREKCAIVCSQREETFIGFGTTN